ncbi:MULTISPECIES: RNA polymerase sigma factor [Micromonospora]|uniref:RNA polymerase sigma factor n=1 Tax=Micromonospora TaxID=1873 RepID=UPI001F1CC782|nr:sigma factor [Micromonospora rubida]
MDRQRLTDLFRHHGDAIYAYATDRLGGEDAQDLVAEVFIVAWRRYVIDGEQFKNAPETCGSVEMLVAPAGN